MTMVDAVATSEVSVSVTTDGQVNLDAVVEELSEFCGVTVEREMSIISIVGEELKDHPGLAARVFDVVGKTGTNVGMISYGATRINLSFLVKMDRAGELVALLHQMIFR